MKNVFKLKKSEIVIPEILFENAKRTDWYINGGMMGYVWAKERIEFIESIYEKLSTLKTNHFSLKRLQAIFISLVCNESADWHVFEGRLPKSYINNLFKVLKCISKKQFSCNIKRGYFVEDTDRLLNLYQYTYFYDDFVKNLKSSYEDYGFSLEQIENRVKVYLEQFN